MKRIDGIIGNVHADDDLAALYAGHQSAGSLERVVIDADDRRRSRFRATTDAGTDVGVVVDKAAVSAGDVLLAEDERLIVVAFEPRDALVVSLPDATAERLEAAVELGHRIGNQHWDLAIDEGPSTSRSRPTATSSSGSSPTPSPARRSARRPSRPTCS